MEKTTTLSDLGLISLTCVKVITVNFSILYRISYDTNEGSKMMIFSTSFPPRNNSLSLAEAERALQKIERADRFLFPLTMDMCVVSYPVPSALLASNEP